MSRCDGDRAWRPWNAEHLEAGMRIAVVGTRAACDELIEDQPAVAPGP